MNTKVYLYRYYAVNKISGIPELIYTGITNNPKIRDYQHRRNSNWYEESSLKTIRKYNSRSDALKHERNAIVYEAPKFNVYHNSKRHTMMSLNGLSQVAVNGLIALGLESVVRIVLTEAKRHFTVRM